MIRSARRSSGGITIPHGKPGAGHGHSRIIHESGAHCGTLVGGTKGPGQGNWFCPLVPGLYILLIINPLR